MPWLDLELPDLMAPSINIFSCSSYFSKLPNLFLNSFMNHLSGKAKPLYRNNKSNFVIRNLAFSGKCSHGSTKFDNLSKMLKLVPAIWTCIFVWLYGHLQQIFNLHHGLESCKKIPFMIKRQCNETNIGKKGFNVLLFTIVTI